MTMTTTFHSFPPETMATIYGVMSLYVMRAPSPRRRITAASDEINQSIPDWYPMPLSAPGTNEALWDAGYPGLLIDQRALYR